MYILNKKIFSHSKLIDKNILVLEEEMGKPINLSGSYVCILNMILMRL
jgi:hypothetical protein